MCIWNIDNDIKVEDIIFLIYIKVKKSYRRIEKIKIWIFKGFYKM